MNLKSFVIHLSRAKQRRSNVEGLIEQLPFDGEIIEAVDGANLEQSVIAQYYKRNLYKPIYPFALSVNEIACFLSHRKAWQAIIDQDLDAALIFEDDAKLEEGFEEGVKLAIQNIEDVGFIRFPFRDGREKGKFIEQTGSVKLLCPQTVGLGLVAQLISRECAQKLLLATEQFDRPVDTTLQMFWQTKVHPYSIVPGNITEYSSDLGGTTLEKKRDLLMKIKREICRPIYRLKIFYYSKFLARADGGK